MKCLFKIHQFFFELNEINMGFGFKLLTKWVNRWQRYESLSQSEKNIENVVEKISDGKNEEEVFRKQTYHILFPLASVRGAGRTEA